MNMFRTLRADEIDCRIAQIKKNGLSLLLYKDARCDQNILDEVVGPFNWKREHTRDNRNCIVSIKNPDNGEWVSKEDTGTESNTEREKGLASDSFKRACFNWGIGRELYTAPFVWIAEKDCTIKETKDARGQSKFVCYDRFTVKGIGYTDGVITGLEIKNQATGKVCYKWGEINEEAPDKPEQPDDEPEQTENVPANVEKMKVVPDPQVSAYLKSELKLMRETRGISPSENNDLFRKQLEALISAKLAPDKELAEYTMDEAVALIDSMYKNFAQKGTELVKK